MFLGDGDKMMCLVGEELREEEEKNDKASAGLRLQVWRGQAADSVRQK